MAMAASPAPRKTAFTTNSTMIAASPPSMMRGVAAAGGDDRRGRAHEGEEPRSEQRAGGAEHDRHDEGEEQRLHRGAGGALGVLLADPAGDGRGGADAEAHRERVHQGEQRLGEADRGDGVGRRGARPRRCRRRRRRSRAPPPAPSGSRAAGWRGRSALGEVVVQLAAEGLLDDGPEADGLGARGSWRIEAFGGLGQCESTSAYGALPFWVILSGAKDRSRNASEAQGSLASPTRSLAPLRMTRAVSKKPQPQS